MSLPNILMPSPMNHFLAAACLVLASVFFSCHDAAGPAANAPYQPPTYASFNDYPVYTGTDLGMTFDAVNPRFRVWAPTAEAVELRLYRHGNVETDTMPRDVIALAVGENGTWHTELDRGALQSYYTVRAKINGTWFNEVADPYAKAAGVNGQRGCIINPTPIGPDGWANGKRAPAITPTDIILWEMHVRDLTSHPSSSSSAPGSFTGVAEPATHLLGYEEFPTGLEHVKQLGATHVHLLPSFDYASVDERAGAEPQFNWGYDPMNYNVPEGSYSAHPALAESRIWEFKNMVQQLHNNDLRVVMDVVYNHTGPTEDSNFNQLVPGYYYRQTPEGRFGNASGCGNETASERPMMRKFIVESVAYWAEMYRVDGFRFDLMGIHDIETMNAIRARLDEIDPGIFMYGEGWAAGASQLQTNMLATKHNTLELDRIAAFSDDLRDGIKGHWSDHEDAGFVSGKQGVEESIKFGIVAATNHPDVDYAAVNYSDSAWAPQPGQCINYASCHDDLTLWDKLAVSAPNANEDTRIKMHKLAAAIVLTSQGVPFLHAGVEFMRTKGGNHNSYNSPDSVNQINWMRKAEYAPVFYYFQSLIELRKAHPALRLPTQELIAAHLEFLEPGAKNVVAYRISGKPNGESYDELVVLFNANPESQTVPLPDGGGWNVLLDESTSVMTVDRIIDSDQTEVPGISALVLAR